MPPRYRSASKKLNDLLSTSQNKSYFVGAITVLFIVLMTMVVILPAYSAFTFQSEENGKRNQLIEKLTKKLDISKKLTQEYDAKTKMVNYFKEVMPESAMQDTIMDLMNKTIESNSATLISITFNKNPTPVFTQSGFDTTYKAQQISLTIKGSQSSLLNIVRDVEDSRRIFNIIDLTLDRVVQEDANFTETVNDGEYTLNLHIEYYFFTTQAE